MKTRLSISPQILVVLINLVVDVIEGLLSVRLLLLLFGASSIAPFVRWIYETTEPLIYPFVGMFPSPKLTNGFTIEFATIFSIIFYIFVGFIISEIIETIIFYSTQRASVKK